MNQRLKLRLATGVTYLVIGIIGIILRNDLIKYFDISPLVIYSVSVIFILIGVMITIYIYLQGELSIDVLTTETSNEHYKREFEKFRKEINNRINESEKIKIDENKLKNTIAVKIDQITNESLLLQIKNKYESKLIDEIKHKTLESELNEIKMRIESEVFRTSRNGNINLSIGIFTTLTAIFFLGYSLLSIETNQESTISFIYHFVPRLSLSLFIELFSFFFLRIYKKNLEDIKYLNNERTNINLKLIALKTSIIFKESNSLKDVILELSKTERNFILKNGESTVEIEKERHENSNSEKIISGLIKILDKK